MHRRSASGRLAKPLAALKRDVTAISADKENVFFLILNMLRWRAPGRAQNAGNLYGPYKCTSSLA
jgi:hypothetical protein